MFGYGYWLSPFFLEEDEFIVKLSKG
jgi:hypothetical protein